MTSYRENIERQHSQQTEYDIKLGICTLIQNWNICPLGLGYMRSLTPG